MVNHTMQCKGLCPKRMNRIKSCYLLMIMEKLQLGFRIKAKAAKYLSSAGEGTEEGRRISLILSDMKNQRCKNQYCLKLNNWNINNHHKASSIPLRKMHLGATSDLIHFCYNMIDTVIQSPCAIKLLSLRLS